MKLQCLVLAVSCSFASLACAWGSTGHRISGHIAEHYLTPEAKTAVSELLPRESLASAALYADVMRSNPSVFWQKTANPWHYVTVPTGTDYQASFAPPQGDAFTALNHFRQQLENPHSTRQEQQLALRFIIHIIGDLHQPLHVGNGKDRGGNSITLTFYGKTTNFHRLWDSGLLRRQTRSDQEWSEHLLIGLSSDQAQQWLTTDPYVWIKESATLRKSLYPVPNAIGAKYQNTYLPYVERRLQQAGVRIAAYLNELYGGPPKKEPQH